MFKTTISALTKIWYRTRKDRKHSRGDDTLNILIPSGLLAIAMFIALVVALLAILSVLP